MNIICDKLFTNLYNPYMVGIHNHIIIMAAFHIFHLHVLSVRDHMSEPRIVRKSELYSRISKCYNNISIAHRRNRLTVHTDRNLIISR